jgi:hypothetical protein
MSFLDRAKQAARDAAEQATEGAKKVATTAANRAQDPDTQERARQALALAGRGARDAAGKARRGLTTVIERIEPGTLADVIIRATAVQEKTNDALRRKGSLYRISELSISATIPPGINFAIGRLEEGADAAAAGRASVELIDAQDEVPVLALDGAVDDEPDPAEVVGPPA